MQDELPQQGKHQHMNRNQYKHNSHHPGGLENVCTSLIQGPLAIPNHIDFWFLETDTDTSRHHRHQ